MMKSLSTTNTPITPPILKPLTKRQEKKALKYIRKCEQGKNKDVFQDFEQKILAMYEEERVLEGRSNRFEEYVEFEVFLHNQKKNVPFWNVQIKYVTYNLVISMTRWRARFRYGATTKYHAMIYRQLIHDEFIME